MNTKQTAQSDNKNRLSPGQQAMWNTSLFLEGGYYIEQILVRLAVPVDPLRLEDSWSRTVAAIPALQMRIDGTHALPTDQAKEAWANHAAAFPKENQQELLESDRLTGFPENGNPPWRCQYWVEDGTWLWTVHHALLDGRSIAAVLRHFLLLTATGESTTPPLWAGCLAVDDEESSRARAAMETIAAPPRDDEDPLSWYGGNKGVPWRCKIAFPPGLRDRLDQRAVDAGTTVHGLVQWAWAWTVARVGGYPNVSVGLVRSAHWTIPKPGTAAGYLMTTMPVPALAEQELALGDALKSYRDAVLSIRDFSRADPREMAAGLGRPTSQPWDAVVMTENASLEELVVECLPEGFVNSISIHERTGEPLTASAWLGKHSELEVEALPDRFSVKATRCLAESWLKAIGVVGGK